MSVLFAAAGCGSVTLLIGIVWLLIIKGLILWWIIHAMIKYRVFRYIVLALFVSILASVAAIMWAVLLARPHPSPAAPAAVPSAAAPQKEPEPAPKAGQAPATIRVRLPADAELWVAGARTTATGRSRSIKTPPLDPDQDCDVEVRASWVSGGVVERTRHVQVRAGDKAEVDFTRPDPTPAP